MVPPRMLNDAFLDDESTTRVDVRALRDDAPWQRTEPPPPYRPPARSGVILVRAEPVMLSPGDPRLELEPFEDERLVGTR